MPDSSKLWLAADGADERQMFDAALDYHVWIYPRELTDDLRFKMARNQSMPQTKMLSDPGRKPQSAPLAHATSKNR